MIFFPKAKINIGLRITGKRADGYHNIETLFYPVSLLDVLEYVIPVVALSKDIITVSGINTGTDPEENLVYKAIIKLREKYKFPFLRIHLHKIIPVGAGLGGGSSDAATFLKTVDKCLGLSINKEDLMALALGLGSDCPFFIDSNPAFATGRGEVLTSVKPLLSGYYLILANPGSRINTAEAYRNCSPGLPSTSLLQLAEKPVAEWKDFIINDFETYAFTKYPLIRDLKNEMYNAGAIFSLMSGSGSSVYGIFTEKPEIPERLMQYIIFQGLI
jgi:4-diphosphocytidyl-2-C-methyl-D-erythritol kinase